MDEQRELDELTRTMTEQQTKLAETMEEMKSKASTLQEKLDRKAELSKTNAELGIKRVALEYKVVELQIPHYQTKVRNNQTHNYRDQVQQEWDDNYQAFRELEKAKLNELGELGWKLQSISQAHRYGQRPQNLSLEFGVINIYYLSRPL